MRRKYGSDSRYREQPKHKIMREKLENVFGKKCWYCGTSFSHSVGGEGNLECDHIDPEDKEAGALACGNCNRAKLDQDVGDFLKWLVHIRSSEFQCLILSKLPKRIVDKLEDSEWDLLRKG